MCAPERGTCDMIAAAVSRPLVMPIVLPPRQESLRRLYTYKPFRLPAEAFFFFKGAGLPTLTAYFLCEPSNSLRTMRCLEADGGSTTIQDEALRLLQRCP